jgi:predicted ATPase
VHLREVRILSDAFPTRDHYPFNLRVLQETPALALSSAVTFFVGENGTGKSTLLEAIARKAGIHIWEGMYRARHGRHPHEKRLHTALEIDWTDGSVPGSFFASTSFDNFARLLDEWASATPDVLNYFGGESLITKSHGQSIMAFFRSRYAVKGLYLLDEPETALSPKSQIELLQVLDDAVSAGLAQFIIATHSPILMACPGAHICSFDSAPVSRMAYEDTSHFQLYRDFLNNQDASLSGTAAD